MSKSKSISATEAQSLPIPEPLFTRLLSSISMLEVYNRSLDDEHASEQMALQVVIRELHAVYDELDDLHLPGRAERLRMVEALPANAMKPKTRATLLREIKAAIKGPGSHSSTDSQSRAIAA